MSDDDRARELLTMAATPPGPPVMASPAELVARGRAAQRRRRVAGVTAVVAAVVAAVAVPLALVGSTSGADKPAGRQTPGPRPSAVTYPSTGPGSAAALRSGHWSTLPTAPIQGRGGAASVWTGSQWLIWGGDSGGPTPTVFADGASYDPATRAWAVLPSGPLGGRTDTTSVWTGHDLFIWGGDNQLTSDGGTPATGGGLYDPASRQWRLLPPSPLPAETGETAVWTGKVVVVTGGQAVQGAGGLVNLHVLDSSAEYDPATNRWQQIPVAPVPHGDEPQATTAIAADGMVYQWVSWAHFSHRTKLSFSERIGITLDRYSPESGRWITVHATGDLPRGVKEPAWTGQEIVLPAAVNCPASCPTSFGTYGWRYDPATNHWTAIAQGPGDLEDSDSVWTGKALLGYDNDSTLGSSGPGRSATRPGDAEVWAPDTNRWYPLPRAPYVSGGESDASVWTGSQLLIWGQLSRASKNGDSSGSPRTVGLSFG